LRFQHLAPIVERIVGWIWDLSGHILLAELVVLDRRTLPPVRANSKAASGVLNMKIIPILRAIGDLLRLQKTSSMSKDMIEEYLRPPVSQWALIERCCYPTS